MCKECGNCSKEHITDLLAGVDFIEASELV